MKTVIPKLILSIGLLTGCLIPTGAEAQANQGHHQSGLSGQVVGFPTFVHQGHIRIVSSDGAKNDLKHAVKFEPGWMGEAAARDEGGMDTTGASAFPPQSMTKAWPQMAL